VILPDVNLLVYAFNAGSPEHTKIRAWLEQTIESESNYRLSNFVLSGFLRVVTHPRIFIRPSPLDRALVFCTSIRDQPNCVPVAPGAGHWDIFVRLCREAGAKGNLVPDAYLAALAIESGSELITVDRGFSRFPGLRWRHPLN
jgi:uncharacterized protein